MSSQNRIAAGWSGTQKSSGQVLLASFCHPNFAVAAAAATPTGSEPKADGWDTVRMGSCALNETGCNRQLLTLFFKADH